MLYGRIYCVLNLVSGKRYIGKTTVTLADRWKSHCRTRGKTALAYAIKSYGAQAFQIVEIDSAATRDDLDALERKWISQLDTRVPKGYNLRDGGDGGQHSDTTRAKLSKIMASPEVKERQREGLRRFWDVPANRRNAIEKLLSIRRENYANGKRHKAHPKMSKEAREKMSARRKAAWADPVYRARMMEIFSNSEVNARRAVSVSRARKRQRSAWKEGSK